MEQPSWSFHGGKQQCSRGHLEDEKLDSWATFVTHLGSDLGSVWSGCTAALGKLGWSPRFLDPVIYLLGLCISICALTPFHPIVSGVWLEL